MADVAAKTAEYNQLRMQTLLETITAQRNDAQNQCANLTADKAVLDKALKDTIEANRKLEAINSQLSVELEACKAAHNNAEFSAADRAMSYKSTQGDF